MDIVERLIIKHGEIEDYVKSLYKKEWDKITKDGTYEKILNYYEDY